MPSLVLFTTLLLWAISQAFAHNASSCGAQSSPQCLNASLEYLIRSAFTTPSGLFQGGFSGWIWNIGTISHNLTNRGKRGSAFQSVSLETESFIDLTSPSIGYVGCSVMFHGLTYAATVNGQTDARDCELTLSPACTRAMLYDVASAAWNNASIKFKYSDTHLDATVVCANLAKPIPAACDTFFTKNAYTQTFVFACPDRNSICSDTPASSNFSNPVASWSPNQASYSPSSMNSYNNITTAILLIITSMVTNQTTFNASRNYFTGHISCLRPANVSLNSMPPSRIPNDGVANLIGANVSPSERSSLRSTATSTIPTSGVEGLRLMMDWMCVLGIGVLLWGVLSI